MRRGSSRLAKMDVPRRRGGSTAPRRGRADSSGRARTSWTRKITRRAKRTNRRDSGGAKVGEEHQPGRKNTPAAQKRLSSRNAAGFSSSCRARRRVSLGRRALHRPPHGRLTRTCPPRHHGRRRRRSHVSYMTCRARAPRPAPPMAPSVFSGLTQYVTTATTRGTLVTSLASSWKGRLGARGFPIGAPARRAARHAGALLPNATKSRAPGGGRTHGPDAAVGRKSQVAVEPESRTL